MFYSLPLIAFMYFGFFSCLPLFKVVLINKPDQMRYLKSVKHNILYSGGMNARVLCIDARTPVPLNFYGLPALVLCYSECSPWTTGSQSPGSLSEMQISRSHQKPIESELL